MITHWIVTKLCISLRFSWLKASNRIVIATTFPTYPLISLVRTWLFNSKLLYLHVFQLQIYLYYNNIIKLG